MALCQRNRSTAGRGTRSFSNAIDHKERHIGDRITRSCHIPGTVNVTLMRLEIKRVVRALPGRRYVRQV